MPLLGHYEVKFTSNGTEILAFELTDPPLSLDFGSKDPTALINPVFRPISNVPVCPPLKECALSDTTVTATFAAPLPEGANIAGPGQGPDETAYYSLAFDLVF